MQTLAHYCINVSYFSMLLFEYVSCLSFRAHSYCFSVFEFIASFELDKKIFLFSTLHFRIYPSLAIILTDFDVGSAHKYEKGFMMVFGMSIYGLGVSDVKQLFDY